MIGHLINLHSRVVALLAMTINGWWIYYHCVSLEWEKVNEGCQCRKMMPRPKSRAALIEALHLQKYLKAVGGCWRAL